MEELTIELATERLFYPAETETNLQETRVKSLRPSIQQKLNQFARNESEISAPKDSVEILSWRVVFRRPSGERFLP